MRCGQVASRKWGLVALVVLMEIRALADTEYFPPRAFVVVPPSGLQDISGTVSNRYTEILRTMKEPSLWNLARQDKKLEAYRLVWIPTWGNTVAVRIEKAREIGRESRRERVLSS